MSVSKWYRTREKKREREEVAQQFRSPKIRIVGLEFEYDLDFLI